MISTKHSTEFIHNLRAEVDRVAGISPDWLASMRNDGFKSFEFSGVPTTHDEEWKYTSLKNLTSQQLVLSSGEEVDLKTISPYFFHQIEGPRVVIINGRFDTTLSVGTKGVSGLTVSSLKEAMTTHPDLVKTHLGKLASTENHPFAALNTALFEDGLFLQVERNAVLEKPIQVLYYSSSSQNASVNIPRSLMIFEESSQSKIVEIHASSSDSTHFTNSVSEILVKANAHVQHIKVGRESDQATHIALIEAHQEKDSVYLSNNITFGGALVRNDHNVWLGGENIECTLDGIYVADHNQLIDNHTRLDHAFPNCRSFQVYKGILSDQSTGVFNGKIYVHLDAQKTDAKQTNQALLLSDKATINTKPQLEIFADDVKCTHGATVGQLSEESLFYLKSRGISQDQAKAILVYAFASEVLEKVTIIGLAEALESLLLAKLKANNMK